jgi:hypothetical protein
MKKLVYSVIIISVIGCKERYISPVHQVQTGYLIVEGVVNSGQGLTTISLSRSSFLDSVTRVYENGAAVTVIGEDNSSIPLNQSGPGTYTGNDLPINSNQKYKLDIKTVSGKEYVSDFVPVLVNPPIDSISWKRENGGLQLYINTHNPLNNTRYYQWTYEETWEFRSSFYSSLRYYTKPSDKGMDYHVGFRDSTTFAPDLSIHRCWQFNNSSELVLGSSSKLSQDIIYLPIVNIPKNSWELSELYSLRVVQYAWSKEGYNYLEIMKKNTEATGSVFDPQPSQLAGNIHCISDPLETVIGIFNVSPVREMRIFISNKDIPDWGYFAGCTETIIENISDSIKGKGIGLMPTNVAKQAPGGAITTFYAADPYCVDCTLRGSNIKPVYWP